MTDGLQVRKGDTLNQALERAAGPFAYLGMRSYPIDTPFVVPAAGWVWLAINDDGETARVDKFVPLEPKGCAHD